MGDNTANPPVASVDNQDPLPESNWTFRRWFTGGSLVAIALFRAWETYHNTYRWETDVMFIMIMCFYMVAPSAEQLIRGIQVTTLFKGGFGLTKTATATSTPEGTTASATATLTPPESSNVQPVNTDVEGQGDPQSGAAAPFPSGNAPFPT